MKKIIIILLILLFITFSFAQDKNVPHYVNMNNPTGLVNPDGFFEYMIIGGDCLWFIANDFYNDPFKWTKIHKANPYIIDPDWIYPNNWLVIPNVFADDSGKPIYSCVEAKDIEADTSTELKAVAIDLDGDGIIDGVDLDGDGIIDAEAGIDLDGDGVIDGYDVDGDGNIDIKAGAAILAATTTVATIEATIESKSEDIECEELSVESYCGKPGWKLGLHAGYPIGEGPEDENLNIGLLLGTPLSIKAGPLSVGLGAGAFTYDFDKFYIGGGLLASLCINDLLKLDMPLILQLHGVGFYVFGEDQGLGIGAIGSGSVPLGKTPLNLGLYGALGKYYPGDNDYNWSNVGAVLFYTL